MKLQPVYNYLSNSLITDKGLEYFPESKKALCIARLSNSNINDSKTYGFLFKEVESVCQKVKNNFNKEKLGCDDIGMPHFLYASDLDNGNKCYIIHSDEHFIVIEATSVQIIEGLIFM